VIHVHALRGCAPAPLAHYLKALGVFRLIAEQKDPSVLGWWEDECFHIATVLEREAVRRFVLDEYAPTPVFNPWGGRSGYYAGASEASARKFLTAIAQSSAPRMARFRRAIDTVKSRVGTGKPEDPETERQMLRQLRVDLDPVSLEWLDACVALVGDDVKKPPIFGTGGNEGSGSYTSGYMSALVACLLDRAWDHALDSSLFTKEPSPRSNWSGPFGQFLPSGVGSPWDLLLAFEGAVSLRSAVSTRARIESGEPDVWASSPFYVAPRASGYGSSAPLDEVVMNKGKALPGRGEQWFPIWEDPATFGEVRLVFAQGRATNHRLTARDGYSMSRAATSFGVQRGITEFLRYGYQQRNNVATHFAVLLGRFRVPDAPSTRASLLGDLEGWRTRLERRARKKGAPSRLRAAEHSLSTACFSAIAHPDEPLRWQSVLLALADVEAVLKSGSGFEAGPIPKLQPEWTAAADDGSAEVRLAVAFALQGGRREDGVWDGVRRHWLPLDGRRFATTGDVHHQRVSAGPEVVMNGRSGAADAVALLERRLVEGSTQGNRQLDLMPAARAGVAIGDLARLVAGEVDLDRTLALARAFMAIDARTWRSRRVALHHASDDSWPDDAWLAMRLAIFPTLTDQSNAIAAGADPSIVRRLAGGDAAGAFEITRRRLRARGISCALSNALVDAERARLWASALAFPISHRTARILACRLDPSFATKGTNL
jgi:CRISPR-associated protein Csx17